MGKVIGIDLGTTYSAAAVFSEQQGRFVIIRSRAGTSTTPSVVSIKDTEILVGDAAKKRLASDPANTVAEIKRHMGEPFRDADKKPRLGKDGNPVPYTVMFGGKEHTPQMISAYILKDIKAQAEERLGEPVTAAVITVPAYFEEGARRATKEAGQLAGLEVKCLLSEPTAAAIAFGMDQKRNTEEEEEDDQRPRRVLVYDLGGGTFDVSIIEILRGNIEVKGVDGDHYLGGIDFDRAIFEWLLRKIQAEYQIDLRSISGVAPPIAQSFQQACHRLQSEAEKIKIALSAEQSTQVAFPFLFMHPTRGEMINIDYKLSRSEFLTLIAPLLKKTLVTVDRALEGAKLTKADIDDVLLVGGSTRIPKIGEMVEKYFGRPARTDVHPDECVAMGAAMQALRYVDTTDIKPGMEEKIAQQLEQMGQVVDITGHSLGVREGHDNMSVLIPKNSPIPASSEQVYQTAGDFATMVKVLVYQGEDTIASRNTLLADIDLDGLPPMPAGDVKIKIRFTLDINGVLNVDAKNLVDGKGVNVNTKYGGAGKTRLDELLPGGSAAPLGGKSSPQAGRGLAIPADMQDTWRKAQELLPRLDATARLPLERALKAYSDALAGGDAKAAAVRADALMDTLFEVLPV